MRAVIRPGQAHGRVTVPGSKSAAHRLLIGAALSDGTTEILSCPDNEDTGATADCLRALGASVIRVGDAVTVTGIAPDESGATRVLPCRASGSTLRFLLPLALTDGVPTCFTGVPRLFERPLSVYEDICRTRGIRWERETDRLTVCGRLTAGDYAIPGDVSSQFITGLLFALPRLEGDSRIVLTTPSESRPYIDLSLDALDAFGVRVLRPDENTFVIPGGQRFTSPGRVRVPGDESAAAFFGALNALGGCVTIDGADPGSRQGDRVWRQLLGACVRGCPTISLRDCPDLGPILMVVGALLHGVRLTNTSRLRLKESDRGTVLAGELRKCGVDVRVSENGIVVPGGQVTPPRGTLDSHGDHRAAMALGVLCTVTGGTVTGAECVGKSLPEFWRMLSGLEIGVELLPDDVDL